MAVPKLRFKEFDGEWKSTAIGNFLKIKSGLGFKAEEYTAEEEIRLLQIENVGYGRVKWTHNVKFVPSNYLELHKDLVLKEGDLVLALNRPVTNDQLKIAKLTREDSPSILYQRVGKLNFLKEDFDRDFIFQIFQKDVKSYVSNSSIGSDQPFISTTDLYKHKLCIPSKEEQTQIASFLSAVDEKISQLLQKLHLLGQYKQGMMQKLFSQQIRFKADDDSEFSEWGEKPLSEIGSFKNGLNKDKDSFGFGFPFINLMDVFGKKVVETDRLGLVDANQKDLENYDLKKGDVLFIRSSVKAEGVGQTALVIEDLHNIVYSGFLIRFRESYGLDLGFKKYCFMNNDFRLRLLAKSTTSANTNINQESLSTLSIKIPCLEEQNKIANFLSAIDQKIDVVSEQLEQTKLWKKGLLQQMFV